MKKIGIIAGNFDVIHPGYIIMFKEMKEYVDNIHVLLHIDPSIERAKKIKPILSASDRKLVLLGLKGVSEVTFYHTEKDLLKLIININPDVRFLGDDYIERKNYTGYGLPPEIIFLNRAHGWSTTKFKQKIAKSIL